VLEIACGTGIVTRRLREALPAGSALVATDLNEPMVAYARESVPADGIEWQVADAQDLPFDDASFDIVVCQFGLMFLPDRVRGFGEAHRVLAPAGALLANAWLGLDRHPVHQAMQDALEGIYPDDPPRFMDTPHGYHDAERIRSDATAGGFASVELEIVEKQSEAASARDFALGFARGSPLTHELTARDADLDEVVGVIERAVALVGGSAPCRVDLAATVITATRA
jgi:SAM-dependent methyltransferase